MAEGGQRWVKAQELEADFWVKHKATNPDPLKPWVEREAVYARLRPPVDLAGVMSGKSVLEVGCGGTPLLAGATMARKRVGIDPLIDHYAKLGFDFGGVEVLTLRAEDMAFRGEFEVVVCMNVLDHTDVPSDALANIGRALVPDGRLLFDCEIKKAYRSQQDSIFHPHLWTSAREMRTMIEVSGFKTLSAGQAPHRPGYSTFLGLFEKREPPCA